MILNCIKERFMWWIVATLIFGVFCAFLGGVTSLAYIAYNLFRVYTEKYDWSTGEEKKKDNNEGGAEKGP
jgi:hypothetical protein